MEAMQTRYGQNIKRYYTGYEIHLGHRKLMLYADLGLAYFHSKENSVVNIISNLTLKMLLIFPRAIRLREKMTRDFTRDKLQLN